MTTKYGQTRDNFATTTAAPYTAGGGSLALAGGAGATLGSLPAGRVWRFTAGSGFRTASEVVLGVFEATGRTGDTLTGVTASSGYADVNIPSGSQIEIRWTAAHADELQTDVAALVAATGGTIGGSISGGTAGRVLFEGAGPVLADASTLTYDPATGGLSATGIANDHGLTLAAPAATGQRRTWISPDSDFGHARWQINHNGGALWLVVDDGGNSYTPIDLHTQTLGVVGQVASASTFAVQGAASQAAPLVPLRGISSSSTPRDLGYLDAGFVVSTDATYTGYVTLSAVDHSGIREGIRVASDGTQALVGFYDAAPVARAAAPTTLADVISILRNLGFCS